MQSGAEIPKKEKEVSKDREKESGQILRRQFTTGEVEVTKYVCPYCSGRFDSFDVLKAHVTAEHRREPIPEEVLKLTVNGEPYELKVGDEVKPWHTLAYTLRETLGLTGTKVSCDRGECGACTVLVDGKPILSCMTLAVECDGKKITTIEGLAEPVMGKVHPIQKAFMEKMGFQCGFCTPGIILTTKALLDENPNPTEKEVREALSGNLCRCTGYVKIFESVIAAAEMIGRQKNE